MLDTIARSRPPIAFSDGTITGYRLGARLIRIDLNQVDEALRIIPNADGRR